MRRLRISPRSSGLRTISTRPRSTSTAASSPHRHCEERSDEAVHSFFVWRHGLLRFARNDGSASRPTSLFKQHSFSRHNITISRRDAPEPCIYLSPNRGRRECRALGAPAASCAVCWAHTSVVTTVTPEITRHSLRNGFNGFLRALPGDRAFLSPSLAEMFPANLTPASRRQDHTTSPSASLRPRQKRCSRPPHPAPRP
jgi:hypothetical protein